MDYVGILGKKGSGKDTLADYLVEHNGFIKYSFIDPIKNIVKILFNLSDTQVNGYLKENVDKRWGLSPRVILQRFGTEFGQYKIYELFPELKTKVPKRNMWMKLFDIFLEENKDKNIVIADVRFQHEVDYLNTLNFNIIKLNRSLNKMDSHISENEIDLINNYDYVIDNNSTKEELYGNYENFIYIPF